MLREFLGTRRFRRNDKQKQAEIESILSEGDSWSTIEEEDDTLESEMKEARDDETKEETAAGKADFFCESGSMPKHKVMNHFPFFDFLNGKQKSRRTAAKTEQPTDNKPFPIHAPTEKESFEQDKTTSFLEEVREEPEWACSGEEDDDDGSSGVLESYSFNRNWSELATRSVDHTFVPTEESSSTVGSFASPLLPKKDEVTFKRSKKGKEVRHYSRITLEREPLGAIFRFRIPSRKHSLFPRQSLIQGATCPIGTSLGKKRCLYGSTI